MIQNNLFKNQTMLGAFLSNRVAMAKQISKKMPRKISHNNIKNINSTTCDSVATIIPGDVKYWIKSKDESGPILITNVSYDPQNVPAFTIQFKPLRPLSQWLKMIAKTYNIQSKPDDYQTIVLNLRKSPLVIDNHKKLLSLLVNIQLNKCDLDHVYVLSMFTREKPSYDKITKQQFTVTELSCFSIFHCLFVLLLFCFEVCTFTFSFCFFT